MARTRASKSFAWLADPTARMASAYVVFSLAISLIGVDIEQMSEILPLSWDLSTLDFLARKNPDLGYIYTYVALMLIAVPCIALYQFLVMKRTLDTSWVLPKPRRELFISGGLLFLIALLVVWYFVAGLGHGRNGGLLVSILGFNRVFLAIAYAAVFFLTALCMAASGITLLQTRARYRAHGGLPPLPPHLRERLLEIEQNFEERLSAYAEANGYTSEEVRSARAALNQPDTLFGDAQAVRVDDRAEGPEAQGKNV